MISYKLGLTDPILNPVCNCVIKTDENGIQYAIPFVNDNTDYQEYLKWVALGNTPEAAE